jgi:hypothetical protein
VIVAWVTHTTVWELHVSLVVTVTTALLTGTWLVDRWFSRRPPRF